MRSGTNVAPWLSARGDEERVTTVGNQLNQYLAPEYISYRKGEGGRMLAYIEGHEVISILNTIFGWDRWNSKVVSFETDYVDVSNGGKWNVRVAATVRLTALVKKGGKAREVWHKDTGYGTIDNGPSRRKAMEKCRKEAVTDGSKRVGRQFGNATSGYLYNKEYLERVRKVKGPAERIEFVEEELRWKPINKRERYVMAQESATVAGSHRAAAEEDSEEYRDNDENDWLKEAAEVILT